MRERRWRFARLRGVSALHGSRRPVPSAARHKRDDAAACLTACSSSKRDPSHPPSLLLSLSLSPHTSQSRSPRLNSVGILQQLDFSPSVSLSHLQSPIFLSHDTANCLRHVCWYCCLLCADLQYVEEKKSVHEFTDVLFLSTEIERSRIFQRNQSLFDHLPYICLSYHLLQQVSSLL